MRLCKEAGTLAYRPRTSSIPAAAQHGDIVINTAAQIQQDRALYVRHCAQCLGINMVTPGTVAFDLRTLPHDAMARFVNSVTHGKNNRMPAWGDVLSPQQIDELWAYVQERRQVMKACRTPYAARCTCRRPAPDWSLVR